MLYDIRTDEWIAGKTLWSPEEINSNVKIVPCRRTNTEVDCANKISEQFLACHVNGNLKLKVLCNSFDLQGSAAYLKDSEHSKRKARVVLNFDTRTQLRQLTMEHLKNTKILHDEILDEDIATHVVVGIEYGGKITMKFAEEVKGGKDLQKLQAELKMCVEKLNVKVSPSASDTKHTDKITCQVYSDFPVEEYPSTYEEAVKFYKNLPSLIGKYEIGVPVMVYLLTLDNLRCALKRKMRPEVRKRIRVDLIDKAIDNIEQLLSVLTEWKDLELEDNFPSLKRQLTLFAEMVQNHTTFFKKKISQLCESVDDDDFNAFLKEQEASVFSCFKRLDEKKVEIKALQEIFKLLNPKESTPAERTPFVSSEKLMSLKCDTEHLVCLAVTLSSDEDAQFSSMQAFLKKREMQKFETIFNRAKKRFKILKEDNQRNKVVKFVATEEPLNSLRERRGVYVRYYYEGKLQEENLMELKESQNLRVVDVSSDSVELAWDYSLVQLNGKEDKVQYKTDHDDWQTSSAECKGRKATIQGLKPATEYTFRVHAPDQIFLSEIGGTIVKKTNSASYSSNFIGSNVTVQVEHVIVVFALIIAGLIKLTLRQ